MELAGLEMVKAMEASRCESEKRRAESETELARMMLRTQSQIASFVVGDGDNRKRKRGADGASRDSSVR
ncbi:peroxisomal ATPase pex1-like [Hibiscus syriacus]|uniref:Peroxisomal ATPase pex1-like n=1 Tax=Hibiscus syriacus TaxID=106335 RepID=A0A6A3BCX0_HIBSY|nr:peroxisomal ATPase pex1-like [Hibiscus syriacus]